MPCFGSSASLVAAQPGGVSQLLPAGASSVSALGRDTKWGEAQGRTGEILC